MASTAWLTPTASSSSGWTPFVNPSNAYAVDGIFATASGPPSISPVTTALYESGGGIVYAANIPTSASVTQVTRTFLKANDTLGQLTYAKLVGDQLRPQVAADSSSGIRGLIQVRGFDFSSVPLNAAIDAVRFRVTYRYTSSLFELDAIEMQVDYTPAPATISPDSIDSLESVGDVSFTSQFINPDSVTSGEEFDLLLVTMFMSALGDASTQEFVSEPTFTQSPPPPPPPTDWSAIGKEDEKVYVYKVYSASGAYIGVWSDVKDDLMFTQQINSPGTTTTVQLARSANTLREVRDVLTDQTGATITDQAGQAIYGVYNTTNAIGPGTDVELNYRVDVYVHYGGFEPLLDQLGAAVTDQAGDPILVPYGAPLGRRIFSGFILDYESDYGSDDGVTVTLASHGFELSHELVRDGDTVVVTKSSTELGTQIKQILDTNPQTMSYSTASIDNTGISPTTKFQLNTKYEGIKLVFDQVPGGWYWYGNVAENLIYLKQKSAVADHTFLKEHNIKGLRVKRSMESLKNRVYFLGGEVTPGTPSSVLFKKTDDATSQSNWRVGLERKTDRRYTVAANAQRYMDKVIARYKNPIFTSPIVISAARYDIESIKLGQVVQFRNFGNFIDDLAPLQIVSLSYTPYAVSLQLGELLESQSEIIDQVESDLTNDQYETIPNAPS